MARKLPLISVVVCCYNGADVLPGCLEALQKQNWKGRLEIIVVDDGSVDATSDVARAYNVRLIRNAQNRGLAGSRNVGIAAAKGDIIAFTDDDCRPKRNWISELYTAYQRKPDAQGVGGSAESTDHSNIVLRYLHASKPLKPLEKTLLASNGFIYRFGLYMKGLLGIGGGKQKAARRMRPVYSLVGANMSFRASALKAVDMFDERFRFGGEEEDICKRLNQLHPESLYFAPKAIIVHQYDCRLRDTLRRSQAYGKGNARMSRKHADVRPVIYPFPPLLLATALFGFIHPLLALLPVVLVPLVYARWLMLALRSRTAEPLLYPYIQYMQEWYSNVGFMKGWWQFRHLFKPVYADMPGQTEVDLPSEPLQPRWRLGRRKLVLLVVAALAVFVAAGFADGLVRLVATLPLLVVLPGFLLLVACGVSLRHVRSWLYVVAGSVGLLIILGLLLNSLVLLFDKQFTLSAPLFMAGFVAVTFVLLAVVWRRLQDRQITIPRITLRQVGLLVPFVLLPFIAAGAAFYLNNTGNNIPVMALLGVVALLLFGLLLRLRKHQGLLVPAVIYLVSLSLLLLGALRGDFVGGTDINKEYYLFNLTNKVGYWAPSLYNDAYNACLAINLLPVFFHKVTGLGGEQLFRIVLPAIYALVPVMVYALCLGRVRKLVACIAAAFFITQPVFLTWASIPLRQMLGFVFFGGLLLAVLDKNLGKWTRSMLIVLFGTAMILSHYSTAYIALACLVIAYLIELSGHVIDRLRVKWKIDRFKPTIGAPLLLVLIGIAVVWYGPVNHVSTNLTDRVQKVAAEITSGEWSISNAFSDEKHAEQTSLIDQFNLQSKPRDAEQVWDGYLAATEVKYAGTGITPLVSPAEITVEPQALAILPPRVDNSALSAISFVGQALSKIMRVFLVIGIGVFAYYFWRRKYRDEHDFMALALASAIIVLAIMVMPYASLDYDLVRTTQQLLLLLALPTVLGGMYLVQFLLRGKVSEYRQAFVIGISVIGFFLYMSGFVPQLTGGATPIVLLNNTGNQYNQLYVHAGEVAAADWLRQYKDPQPLIQSGYFGGNRLWLGGVDRPLFYNDTLPWTIDRDGYVYASYAESHLGVATAYYKGSFVQYAYPSEVLNTKKDVLYSNGQAIIYQ